MVPEILYTVHKLIDFIIIMRQNCSSFFQMKIVFLFQEENGFYFRQITVCSAGGEWRR